MMGFLINRIHFLLRLEHVLLPELIDTYNFRIVAYVFYLTNFRC